MLVKKFEADDMASALKQVKDTLGAEALILSTRTLRKKGLGVLGKQTIEVTAAIESPAMKTPDRQPRKTETPEQPRPAMSQQIPAAYRSSFSVVDDEPIDLPKRSSRKIELAENPLENEIRILREQIKAQDNSHLQAEIDELKAMLKQFAHAPKAEEPVAAPCPQTEAVEELPPRRQPAVRKVKPVVGESDELLDMLLERGIDRDAAATIARFAGQQLTERQRQDSDYCRRHLTGTVADLVQTSGPLWQPGQGQKRVALIGPTGVGKTTTIAKLAADAITNYGARVALITIDTYRIAAVEQIKVYGDIMGLPVEVVLSPEQLQEAIRCHRDKDLILIDTAGRSPRDAERITELNDFLGQDSQVENCLVLAAPTDERHQQQIFESFSRLPISRLIFTKLDETERCGALINLPTKNNLPLAYLTNGQQVPEDLLLAEPAGVAELVMGVDMESRRMAV